MTGFEHPWRVPHDHPAFAGHFPGQPIVPGVVLLDHAMRLAQEHLGESIATWQVTQAKFLSPCGPGESLVFVLQPAARGGMSFVVRGSDRDIASGHLLPGPA